MLGVVTGVAPDGRYGQILIEDGQRFSYWTSEVRNGPVHAGQHVEFQMWEGQPVDIYVANVPQPPPARQPQGPASAPQQRMQASGRPMPHADAGHPAHTQAALAGYGTSAAAGFASATGALPQDNYWVALFTSPSGRISRKQFWLHGVLPLIGASIVLRIILYAAMFISPMLLIYGEVVIFLILLWPQYCISAKRFQDVGYAGWYNIFWIIPLFVAQLISSFDLFFLSIAVLLGTISLVLSGIGALVALAALIFVYIRAGQHGPNQYGADPLGAV